MTPSHGCAGRRGRSWLNTALAASGLCLALPAARPALACHIHHDHDKPSTAASAAPSTSETPTQALEAFMKDWDAKAKPEPQVVAPTSTSPAAQVATTGAPSMPSMQDWQRSTASTCMPPTPPSSCGTSSPTAAAQGVAPSTPLKNPASLMNPTPAPEPSAILTAVALAGAFAWRRRAVRPRA